MKYLIHFSVLFLMLIFSYLNTLAQNEEIDDLYYYYPNKIVHSQSVPDSQKSHFSVALSPILPISLNNNASMGFLSANIGYSCNLTSRLSWCFNLAFNKFGSKAFQGLGYEYESNLAFIPITTGFQCFFKKDEGTRGYWAINGGYYFPAADFETGGWGASSGLGIQIPTKNSNLKLDISLLYNVAFGGTSKVYTVHHGQISGSTTSSFWYTWSSYLAFNIGLVFGK